MPFSYCSFCLFTTPFIHFHDFRTIAAAFGSYDPKEVDALREAIVECMRNTPLDGGIRATGAVRQLREEQNNGETTKNSMLIFVYLYLG